jgi:hypothetical protein
MGGADGVKVREEIVDRAYDSGMMSFVERWSKKKDLKRRLNKGPKVNIKGGNDENHKGN